MDRNREPEMELRRGSSPSRASRSPEVDGDKAVSHTCCICGKSFPFQSSLSQHMRKHTGEKPYKCPYCDHRASQKGNLKIHIRSHRTGTLIQGHEPEAGEMRVSEGLDGCASPTKSTSACNRILNGATRADSSKILLRSSRKEAEGATRALEEGRAAARCAFCKSEFERKRDLELHVQQAHKPFQCRLCSYATLREESLLSHVEKDHITAQGPSGARALVENGKPELPPGEFPCEVCGQAFSQTWFLKAHMRKHRGSFDHGCHICGRRFKEPWFLKNHMKAHGPKTGSKNKPRGELDPIATINNVVQEEMIVAGLSLYEVCTKCGNLFTNLDSLNAHNAIHRRVEAGRPRVPAAEGAPGEDSEPGGPADRQQLFLRCLDLRPADAGVPVGAQAGRRVAELDPVNSYQAWQLATRGKVAEPAEYLKYGAWDEALAGDVAFDKERREYVLVSQERRKREPELGAQGPPRKRAGAPGDPGPGPLEPRPAARPSRRPTAPAGHGKSSECFECGKIFRTYHQMVLHSRVHRRARRDRDGPGDRAPRTRCSSLSEGDSASQPSSPGSACAAADSPGSGLAEEAADGSGEEGVADPAPGGKPGRSCFSGEVAPAVRPSGGQTRRPGGTLLERGAREPRAGSAASASLLESSHRDASRRPGPPRVPMDLKTPALQPRQEGPGPRSTDFRLDLDPDPTSPEGADPPLSSQNQGGRLHREPLRLHTEEPPRGGRRAPAPDLVPLDLSERSTRAHSGRRGLASPQAALAIHPCPYCDHKTYYPEVLWVHKRIWHRVSCSSAAPQWIQPNGYKSIRHNLVFLARSGRTGPPPALGGKECQPLPIARFTRTQVPGGAPGPKGSSSPLNVTTRAAGMPRSKESHPGGSCALWAAGPDGHWQSRPGPGSEQHGAPALLPPQKTRQEAGPRPGPTTGGGFSRSATPTPTSVTRAGSQSPANSRPGDKYIVPAVGTSLGHLNKHSAPDPLKAKFSPQPQGQLHGIGDGGPPLPPQEPPSKAGQELRPLAGCGGGSRGNAASQGQPVLHAAKQESASEGHEKRLDILSIFKTYIPKDFASLYQSWGASGPVPEHRGVLRTQAHQGDFICAECGKCFQQPSHLRAHMRAHTVVFESNGLRGAEVHATSADAPKQGRDHSNTDPVQTVPLRKGT